MMWASPLRHQSSKIRKCLQIFQSKASIWFSSEAFAVYAHNLWVYLRSQTSERSGRRHHYPLPRNCHIKMAAHSLRVAAACIWGTPVAWAASRRPAAARAFWSSTKKTGCRLEGPVAASVRPARGGPSVRYMSYSGRAASNGRRVWDQFEKWLQRAAVRSSKRIFLYNLRGALLKSNEVPRLA
jgi:hypothetical protein